MNRPPRILFVCMQGSIHAARWIECIADAGWDLHMFGANDAPANPNLRGVTLHEPLPPPPAAAAPPPAAPRRSWLRRGLGLLGRLLRHPRSTLLHLARTVPERARARLLRRREAAAQRPCPAPAPAFTTAPFHPDLAALGLPSRGTVPVGDSGAEAFALWAPPVLAEVIDRVQPDLIHSMEFQHNSYRVLEALPLLRRPRPAWLATNWGSDIYHFRHDPRHAAAIRRLLETADFYSCECRRDLALGRDHGYRGPDLPVLPNSGGMDLARLAALRSPEPPSRRKRIMVKGYDHFAGRAMTSLAVLERFAPRLKGYEIVLYSMGARPRARAIELRDAGVLDFRIVDAATHDQMLRWFGSARMYLGISVSDGLSTSSLEAMAMGAFPLQTNTACCDEWFEDGVGGFTFPPDDIELICDRFERALTDDALVDAAAEVNRRTVERRLALEVVQPQVRDFYAQVFAAMGRPLP